MRIKLLLFGIVIYFLISYNPVGACGCSDLYLVELGFVFIPIVLFGVVGIFIMKFIKDPKGFIKKFKKIMKEFKK
jgi:hypothetical protein